MTHVLSSLASTIKYARQLADSFHQKITHDTRRENVGELHDVSDER